MSELKNVPASVLARLGNVAKSAGVVYNEILTRYAIERVLKRIELSEFASKCILKGGSLFILWSRDFSYRPTMDADIEFRGEGYPEALCEMFKKIAAVRLDVDDGLRVDEGSVRAQPIREDDVYGGVRVTMLTYIGTVLIRVQFDVGIGDAITPAAKKAVFPALLGGPAPRIRVYPRETVIAEKFETIVKRGLANSRMKDYYDLWVLSKDTEVDLAVAHKAMVRTFDRRKTVLPTDCPIGLADGFPMNSDKQMQWKSFLRKNRLEVGSSSFVDVVRTIRGFMERILKS